MAMQLIGVGSLANYWLCVTNEENWKVVRCERIWGVSDRNKSLMQRVKRGDLLVFYVKKKKIGGVFEVLSDPFKDEHKVFRLP